MPYNMLLSEVHVGKRPTGEGKEVTLFQVGQDEQYDSDGDLNVARKEQGTGITIHHHLSTTLNRVGLQVWRGSLLIADFLLNNKDKVVDKTVIELGCGTGLGGILAAKLGALRVYFTDFDEDVLSLCQSNVEKNVEESSSIAIYRKLDWREPLTTQLSENDLAKLKNASTILAADCIYDDNLSTHLVETIQTLLKCAHHNCILYMTCEKRYNFTLSELDVRASAYDHFLSLLSNKSENSTSALDYEIVPLSTIKQKFLYDRSGDLVLFKVWQK